MYLSKCCFSKYVKFLYRSQSCAVCALVKNLTIGQEVLWINQAAFPLSAFILLLSTCMIFFPFSCLPI